MAPPPILKPKQSRPSLRTKTSKSGSGLISRPPPSHRAGAVISDSFISSKKDKRTIKSSAFLNRIQKTHAKPAKRRRPNKKLVTNLESLADALPELEDGERAGGKDGVVGTRIKMESLTSGKGLMKRRGKVERVERERFAKNMAQLMGAQQSATVQATATASKTGGAADGGGEKQPSATATRFAALRNWIGQTMEKEKAFETKE